MHTLRISRFVGLATSLALSAATALAITPADLASRLAAKDNVLIVDVRSSADFTEAHIPGALNIPVSLLPYKQLPVAAIVVICGDGLGVIDDVAATAAARAPAGTPVEPLAGGFAGWLSATHMSTAAPGVKPERIPGITYNHLVTAPAADVVLVDLRAPAAAAKVATVSSGAKVAALTAAPTAPDPVESLAAKLGVPRVSAQPAATGGATVNVQSTGARAKTMALSTGTAGLPAGKLLVLVADDESVATEMARQLRASGNYRFTILVGGTDAIRNEGRIGSSRMTSGSYAAQPQR